MINKQMALSWALPSGLLISGLLISGCSNSSDSNQHDAAPSASEAELKPSQDPNTTAQMSKVVSLADVQVSVDFGTTDEAASVRQVGAGEHEAGSSEQVGVSAELGVTTLCAPDQTTYFSCQVGGKLASVCSSGTDELSYRFGTMAKTELVIQSPVNYSRTGYSGGGEGRLRFTRGAYDYVVHSGIYAGEWQLDGTRDKVELAGVYVIKGGKQIANLACDPYPELDLNSAELPKHKVEEFIYYD